MKQILFLFFIINSFLCYGQVKHESDDDRIINIPVIFHVIYSDNEYNFNSENFNQSDSLNYSTIIEELKDLNLDFLAKNDRSNIDNRVIELVGKPNIKFVIADTVLQKGGEKGVIRIFDKKNDKNVTLKSKLINPGNFLNVYIANVGNATSLNGEYIKLNFNKIGLNSHVLTHEAGHWLGLYHIWGRTGSCNWFKTLFKRDDYIEDTPPQRKCSDRSFSKCPPKNRAVRKNEFSNYNNFMDYSGCRCMFTKKQAIQMRNNIIDKRKYFFLTSVD